MHIFIFSALFFEGKHKMSIDEFEALAYQVSAKLTALEIRKSDENIIRQWMIDMIISSRKNNGNFAIWISMFTALLEIVGSVGDDKFLKIVIAIICSNNDSCADRSLMTVNQLYTAHEMYKCDSMMSERENHSSNVELLKIFLGAMRVTALQSAIATAINSLRDTAESVEIFLYYEIKLKDVLGLVTFAKTMWYESCGNRLDIAKLAKTTMDTYLDFAANHELSNKFLDEMGIEESMCSERAFCFELLESINDHQFDNDDHVKIMNDGIMKIHDDLMRSIKKKSLLRLLQKCPEFANPDFERRISQQDENLLTRFVFVSERVARFARGATTFTRNALAQNPGSTPMTSTPIFNIDDDRVSSMGVNNVNSNGASNVNSNGASNGASNVNNVDNDGSVDNIDNTAELLLPRQQISLSTIYTLFFTMSGWIVVACIFYVQFQQSAYILPECYNSQIQ